MVGWLCSACCCVSEPNALKKNKPSNFTPLFQAVFPKRCYEIQDDLSEANLCRPPFRLTVERHTERRASSLRKAQPLAELRWESSSPGWRVWQRWLRTLPCGKLPCSAAKELDSTSRQDFVSSCKSSSSPVFCLRITCFFSKLSPRCPT